MRSTIVFAAAAVAELIGCYAVWMVVRAGASWLWLLPAGMSLAGFAWLLTLAESDAAGRAYAAYGGIYIAASLGWLILVEGRSADRWDLIGVLICILGAGVIMFGPRSA